MADIVSKEVRSRNMAAIRGKDTKPELLIRKGLHRLGLRYQLHDDKLPGKPDLVFPKYNAVIFVNGCFWHGHDCHLFKQPETREEFWQIKIDRNRERDAENKDALSKMGWRILTVWECALKGRTRRALGDVAGAAKAWLVSEHGNKQIEGKKNQKGKAPKK